MKISEFNYLGINLKQWIYIAILILIFVLGIGLIMSSFDSYHKKMENKIIENQTNISWLKKENQKLQDGINKLTDSISINSYQIVKLEQKNLELDKKSKSISDSIKKIKLMYYEISKHVDSLDVDGIRSYFAELK